MRRALLLLLLLPACMTRKTGETEVGVLVCKIALGCEGKGVQRQIYPPGSTNFFAPSHPQLDTCSGERQTVTRHAPEGMSARLGPLSPGGPCGSSSSPSATLPKKSPACQPRRHTYS